MLFNIAVTLILLICLGFGYYDYSRPKTEVLQAVPKVIPMQVAPPETSLNPDEELIVQKIKLAFNTAQFEVCSQIIAEALKRPSNSVPFDGWLRKQMPVALTAMAWMKIQEFDCDGALKILYRSLQWDRSLEAQKALGYCLIQRKSWPEAASFLTTYVLGRPSDTEGRSLLADALESLGRFDEATTQLEAMCTVNQNTNRSSAVNDTVNRSEKDILQGQEACQKRLLAMKAKSLEGVKQRSEWSKHFYVSYRGEEHDDLIPWVFEVLETSLEELRDQLGLVREVEAIEVILYRAEDFHEMIPGGPAWSEGVFDGRIRVPVRMPITAEGRELIKTILIHELTHALLAHRSDGRAWPTWFNEGLAQYLSCRGRPCGTFSFGVSPGHMLSHELLDAPFLTLESIQAGMAYRQSLFLVHSLLLRQTQDQSVSALFSGVPAKGTIASDDIVKGLGASNFAAYLEMVRPQWDRRAL
jgi:tetratricopeptide (TPR) repeat protein